MYFPSKKISLLILGITALVCSRAFFFFLNDPEGPSLLIVVGLAAVVYLLSLMVYVFIIPSTGLKGILLAILAQIVVVTGLYLALEKDASEIVAINSFAECEAAGYPVGESYPRQCWTPEGKNFVEEVEPREENGEAKPNEPEALNSTTIRGTITCLPKVGTGAQTLECAIGLRADDGKYYALKNLFEHDPQYKLSSTDTKVEVTGTVRQEEMFGPDGNRYDIAGVIYVSSISER